MRRLLISVLFVSLCLIDAERTIAAEPTAITSIRYKTWIWPRPIAEGRFLGYMRVGQRLKLRSAAKVKGVNCRGGFYQVEPRGYVCADKTVTEKTSTRFIEANRHSLPVAGPHPYEFAISSGAPMYTRLPTAKEQKNNEWRYGKAGVHPKLPMFQRGHEHLATTTPIAPSDPVPPFLAKGESARGVDSQLLRRSVPHGTMMSFTKAFDHGGRTFLLSADLTVVPADRVRHFKRSRFKGTKLAGDITLPVAWFREKARPVYALDGDAMKKTGAKFPLRSFAPLSGTEKKIGKKTFLQTKDGRWMDGADTTVARDYGKYPFGVKEGDKWIIVSIMGGTLIAYEGLTPVFATLMSPGLGGPPRRGGDLVKDSTTPTGTFKITFKDRAATMAPEFGEDRNFWIADVPNTQYFSPPFALHTAYWHEKFGELMSGGCINVSPLDGEYLFGWTGPHVPAGWQGATGSRDNGAATWIVVRR